jgi:hypothetical protein
MSSEYRTKLIRRAVDANTSPNVAATPLQARTLHKFFESPQCADIGMAIFLGYREKFVCFVSILFLSFFSY